MPGEISHQRKSRVALSFLLGLLLSATWVLGAQTVPAWADPANLGDLKADLLAYEKYGGYERDLAAVDAEAQKFIESRVGQGGKLAIVLDIDETSLSNWPEIAANDFGYIAEGSCDHLPRGPCGDISWEQSASAEAIQPTLALFNAALARGVTVFFITGRDESLRIPTETNLKRVGYNGRARLIMRPAGTTTASASDFKAPERKKIEAEGYTIIANIGDQPSDLVGGYAERAFLLPNPFYRIR
jgi:predicted secreted acid phosphatase